MSEAFDFFLGEGRRFLPPVQTVLQVAPVAAFFTAIAGWFAGWLRCSKNVRTPYTRKVFHFAIFTAAGLVQLQWGLPGVVVFGGVVSIAVLYAVGRGEGFPFYEAIARPSDRPHRTLYIIVPLFVTAVGGGISNLFFPQYAHVGYFVGGWGDAVGEPVGTRWGRHRYRVMSLAGVATTRSVEGSTAVFTLGSLAAVLALYAAGLGLTSAALIGVGCGFVGATVEAVTSHGFDNLTVQIAAAGTATLLSAI